MKIAMDNDIRTSKRGGSGIRDSASVKKSRIDPAAKEVQRRAGLDAGCTLSCPTKILEFSGVSRIPAKNEKPFTVTVKFHRDV